MKTLRNIAIVLLVLLVLATAIGFLLPSSVHVQRSITIAAPPEEVFDLLNSFKRFNEWSPWYDYDPAALYRYSGPAEGVGARIEWLSQKPQVGSGSQEITASEPPRRVRVRLDMADQRPAEIHYDILPADGGTRLTWELDADFGYNIPYRYFGLFLDPLMGDDLERGLGRIKTLLESATRVVEPAAPAKPELVEVAARELASVEATTSLDPAAVEEALDHAFATLEAFLKANGLKQDGPPLAITRFYDESGWGFEAAVPVAGTPEAGARAAAAAKGVKLSHGYSGSALRSVHVGSRETLPETYQLLEDHAAEQGLDPNGRPWEVYVTDRRQTPEAELRTEVYVPVKKAE